MDEQVTTHRPGLGVDTHGRIVQVTKTERRYRVEISFTAEYDSSDYVGLKDATVVVDAADKFQAMAFAWALVKDLVPGLDEPERINAKTVKRC